MTKLRLNKNALRERTEQLRLYLEFLPTLMLRKRQLQAAVQRVRAEGNECTRRRDALRRSSAPWAALLRRMLPQVRPHAAVQHVDTEIISVAGVAVPKLLQVRFAPDTHSLLATPLVFDDAVQLLRNVATLRAQREVLAEQALRIGHELRRTTQRINLYEEVLIPRTRHEIRRLRVYLGDQQTAAVCRAKIAKAKIVAKAATTTEEGQPWPS